MRQTPTRSLLSPRLLAMRLLRSILFGAGLVVVSLAIGMWGYHRFEGQGWLDAFVNAAMILSGMDPLDHPRTDAGKLFSGLYAIYSGLALLIVAGVAFAPLVHRFLHRFHLEND
jgi:hypothetical protein